MKSDIEGEVLKLIEKRRDEIVEFLRKLISYKIRQYTDSNLRTPA